MTQFNQPLGGNDMPRFAGPATMMRLPTQTTAKGLDVCFVGVPIDIGSSNRSGTRHGPRQIRAEACMIRPYNMATRAYDAILSQNGTPLTLGGDHTLTLPILRAMKKKHGPVALIHIDAHADINDEMFGEKIAHGTPFRRAVEEGLLACDKSFQIGLRGSGYSPDDFDWTRKQGFTVVTAEECWYKSLAPLMEQVRAKIGNQPAYLTYDIDSLDPAFAPGTGTVEVGGLSTWQALEIIRGCRGLNLVDGDLVEVSPPLDPVGNTALIGANFLFEMLCVLPGCQYG